MKWPYWFVMALALIVVWPGVMGCAYFDRLPDELPDVVMPGDPKPEPPADPVNDFDGIAINNLEDIRSWPVTVQLVGGGVDAGGAFWQQDRNTDWPTIGRINGNVNAAIGCIYPLNGQNTAVAWEFSRNGLRRQSWHNLVDPRERKKLTSGAMETENFDWRKVKGLFLFSRWHGTSPVSERSNIFWFPQSMSIDMPTADLPSETPEAWTK